MTPPTTVEGAGGRPLRRALELLRPHRGRLAAVLVVTALLAAATLAIPYLFGRGVTAVQAEDRSRVLELGIAVVAVGVLRAVLTGLQNLWTGRLSVDVERDLRDRMYGHLLTLDSGFHRKQQVGQLVSRLMVTSGPIRAFLGVSLPKISSDVLTVCVGAVAMVVIDPVLALAAAWPMPVVALLVVRYGRRVTPLMREQQEADAVVTADAEESLRGILSVDLLGVHDRRAASFDRVTGRWLQISTQTARVSAAYDAAIVNLPSLAWAGLFLWGGKLALDGDLSVGTLVTFLGFVGIMLGPIAGLGHTLWRTEAAAASATRAYEVLDQAPEVASSERAVALPPETPTVTARDVSKSYDGQAKALDRIALDVAAGRNVAIIGPTGAGKSSLLGLLARIYDAEVGEIRISGHRIDEVDLASLRSVVRFVDTSPHLFPATVAENIAYGRPDATRAEMEHVTRALGLHERILGLPDGYDTPVGEGGLALLEPTAQRISIARALLTEPGLLLLDDVTAPLPPAMEAEVVRGLRELTGHITVVAVANRPALVGLADDVVVLDRGELAAAGTLSDLAESSALFRDVLANWRVADDDAPDGGGS